MELTVLEGEALPPPVLKLYVQVHQRMTRCVRSCIRRLTESVKGQANS